MDKLDSIFQKQAELDKLINQTKKIQVDKYTPQEWIQKKALALIGEVTEVLDETNYKWWKINQEFKSDKLKEELVDVLHFLISMCLTAGLTSEELFAIYMSKHQENLDRQNGKSKKQGYTNQQTATNNE